MRALTLQEIKMPLVREDRDSLRPASGEVVIRLKAAALNRRDYWITQGMYPGIQLPVVLGSDGVGHVTACGDKVEDRWHAEDVVINPGMDWGQDSAAQAERFTILGLPRDGTLADEVAVPAELVHPKPTHLSTEQAAALPLAAVTAFRAVFTQGRLQPGETVLITGIGGGVATFALQLAAAAGAEVWVTSSSPEKIEQANRLGAAGGFNYRQENWTKDWTAPPPQLIIDSAGGDGYADLLQLAAPGGRIVNYGATTGPPPKLDLFKVFWKQLHLVGSTMGSPEDFAQMLAFVSEHRLAPVVEQVLPLEEANEALAAMASSPQFGKYVLKM